MGETLGRLTPIITTLLLVAGSLAVAAIAAGTSRTRLRRAIREELDLLEKLPEGHALRRQLREHTNAWITGYLTPPTRTRVASFFAKAGRRRLAFAVVLVAAGLAVSGAVARGTDPPPAWSWL
ncbi:MAG: hypothetical protein HYU55_06270 [Nocardioides sp.]|nr:hypothetical protein [Nocardioides sp.]